jgi:hypothetical protein
MVASCAGAALGCYLVSLRVASERAALEQVEQEIVLAQRDIRVLQTEIGTRGRLAQLERWNVKVLALSAPSADQFVNGGFELARLVTPQRKVDLEAPVVLASAESDAARPVVQGLPQQRRGDPDEGVSARQLMQTASLKSEPARSTSRAVETDARTQLKADRPAAKAPTAPGSVTVKTATATSKPVRKAAATPKTDASAKTPAAKPKAAVSTAKPKTAASTEKPKTGASTAKPKTTASTAKPKTAAPVAKATTEAL